MRCPACRGDGCDECDDGSLLVTGCPQHHLDADVCELIRFAGYVHDSKTWPVAGGILDQTPAFVEAERMIRSDQESWRSLLMPKNDG